MQINFKTKPLVPRELIYDLYWIFADRRHSIFERRLNGSPWPWVDDPILQKFKFCNTYRAADRVSQYLIRNIAYNKQAEDDKNRVFQIVAFRTFSNIATWEGLLSRLGKAPTIEHLATGAFEKALDDIKSERGRLYTGAFILCATKAFGYHEKHKNHTALFKEMFLYHDSDRRIRETGSLRDLVSYLGGFPLIGPFMSYQIAIDLNYSETVNFNENDYTQAGPGALRGIKKAFSDIGDYSPADVIHYMVDNQEREFSRLEIDFNGLLGRNLHAIDCQNLFCELDKYCREAAPHLISNRSRIKARFTPNNTQLDFFFPPKWNINSKIIQIASEDCLRNPQLSLFDTSIHLA
ncbi:nucleotide kinase domain-containing protein [Capsulimonas corticalis]|nr:nucleotide kinase domain-containing protein [Capsulimonas corticalis]